MEAERLRVAMFSTMLAGGAGYAALRVHNGLRLSGAETTLYVGRAEYTRHPGVVRLRDAEEGLQPPRVPGFTIFSVDPPGIPEAELDRIINDADIFNLHWYARFLSLRNIERLTRSGKPVVLTIRDMNPLAGGCHFFHGCENWMRNCFPCPQFHYEDLPLPRATFEAKGALWDLANISVVVLSDHAHRLVKRSPLLGQCRLEKIPNPIDVSIFKPYGKERARSEFRVPPGKKAIAYLPSFSSAVKGGAQAMEALRHLATIVSADDCVVLCAGDLEAPLDVPFQTVSTGFISNKRKLARFYASADVTLIPSLEETFSNTAAESVACGTPVVGFQVGVIPEIAQGGYGRAVPLGETGALAKALAGILSGDGDAPAALHEHIAVTFGAAAIGSRYLQFFEELCRQRSRAAVGDRAKAKRAPETQLDQLLYAYRERRLLEIETEQSARKAESRSVRGRLKSLVRVGRMLLFDHRAFWRNVGTSLSERR